MEWEVDKRPAYSILKVALEAGESVTAEPGAMVLMYGDVEVETSTYGGVVKGLMRKILGGESMFLNTFKARGTAEVWFAPSYPGDIEYVELHNSKGIIVQDTSYLAHHGNIDIDVAWKGLRGAVAEGEFFWLRLNGYGGVWLSSYGAIEKVELGAGERITVDNFHFVAMDDGMKWSVRKFGSLKSFIFGGEGFVIEIEGPGRVFLQTRALPPFIELVAKLVRKMK